jgi:predicted transcriptional regulator
MIIRRITIIKTKQPDFESVNDALQWIGGSLGLFNLRDKDRSCFRIFIEILKASKSQDMISSDDLADRLSLSRGTVVHHLNKLLESGIIINNRNRYELRVSSLTALVSELERDAQKLFEEMRLVAQQVDEQLGFR